MDEVGDSTQQSQSPVKTEWNSRCVIFTYFQGDISKEVDEHFSRALGLSVSSLQELSPSNHRRRESQQQEEVILTNETDLAPNQWRFSSPWTKPHPEANFGNGDTNGSVDVFEPVAVNPYPITTTRSPLSQPDQPWQSPTLPYSNSLDLTYPSAFSVPEALVPVPEPQQEEKCESLISFLQQDRSIALPQQPVSSISWEDGYMAHTAGGSGLHFNLPPSSSSAQHIDVCGNMQKNCAVSTVGWNTDGSSHHHPNITTLYNLNPTQPLFDKKIYFSPVCETISTGYADEKSQIPETSKDFYY